MEQKGITGKGNAFVSQHKYAGKSALPWATSWVWTSSRGTCYGSRVPALPVSIPLYFLNKVLCHFLEPGELVEADEGYRGHPDKIKCPGNDSNPAENQVMQGRVRARHKMLNGWLKTWGTLSLVFHHRITMYDNVFRACVVVTQLTVENGELLFEAEYED